MKKDLRSFILGLFAAIAFSAGAFIGGGTASSVPVGTCFDFAGTVAPSGYQIADGSALNRSGSALFGVIGTTWGIGDGSSTFNVPDFRRRKTVGSGGSGTAVLANTVGSTGGEESHALTIAELAAHTHTQTSNATGAQVTAFQDTVGTNPTVVGPLVGGASPATTLSTGSGTAHNVRDPSAVVLKICKL